MINSFLMSALAHLVQAIIGSGVFQEIENLVALELSTDKSGAEKAAAVKASLNAAQGDLGTAVKGTAGWALNLGIETAVAVANTKLGVPAVKS
jgi:hypothetical protein